MDIRDGGGFHPPVRDDERPDLDPGWEEYKRVRELPGRREEDFELFGSHLWLIFHAEEYESITGERQEYPELDKVFVGDDRCLFDITELTEGSLDEAIYEKLESLLKEE